MRSTLLVTGLLLLLQAAHAQEIYRWVDKDGVVHYADQPGDPSAKPVTLSTLNVAEPGTAAAPAPPPEERTPTWEYRSFTLDSPAPDEGFQGPDTPIPVTLSLDGELAPQHTIVLFLDGQRVAGFSGLSGDLNGVARGTHFLRAAVLDERGKAVITTAQITFNVRQASSASPPVGPTLRPPPKPQPKRP